MLSFRNAEKERCLVCNQTDSDIYDISINRPFRYNENIVTFAICKECLKKMNKEIEEKISGK